MHWVISSEKAGPIVLQKHAGSVDCMLLILNELLHVF
jgi:hypothetical protein